MGLLLEDAADRFSISPSTMSKIFSTWIKIMYTKMKVIFLWPSREQVCAVTPTRFMPYPNTPIIIDCTRVITPSSC